MKLFFYPAKFRNKAPAGTILVSNRSEDDDEGASFIRVDSNVVGDEEAESIAEEICRRWNAGNT